MDTTTTPVVEGTLGRATSTSRLVDISENTTGGIRYSSVMDVSTSVSYDTFTNFSEMSTTSPGATDESILPIPPLAERVIEALILSAIFVVALSGNILLWAVVLRHRSLKTASNALVLCLSAADILVSTASMPVTIVTISRGEWLFSDNLCTALGFLSMCTFIGSVMSLAVISINRYVLIVHPSKFKLVYTKRNTGFFILGVWTFAALLALPPLTGQWGDYGYLPNQSFCFCDWRTSISYTFFMVGVCFGGPCSVMTFCYINILRVVRQSRKRVASNPMSMGQAKAAASSKTKPVKPVSSFCVNGKNSAQSPTAKGAVNTPDSTANGGDARQILRSHLNDLLRSKTIEMARNDLSGKSVTQKDQSDSDDSRAGSGGEGGTQSPDCSPVKANSLHQPMHKPKEIKWIVPEVKRTSVSVSEDDNSNKLHGSPKGPKATERSSLARLAVPLPADLTRRKQRKKNRSESERRRKEEELKLTKSFLVVIFVFILCWFPFCITMFWSVFSERRNAVPRPIDMGTLLLGYLNSCCNPIIYGVMNKRFRAGYISILCKWRRQKVDSNTTAFQVDGINLNTSTIGSVG